MAQPPPDVSEDECLPEYRHLFCPDLLRDKVAFITGGGSGIGFRIAEIFMRHGCHTVIASRSLPRVSMAARKLAAATGQRCLPLSLDVRAPPAITAAVDQALKEFGKIDILINCAAGNFLCPASTLSFNAFKTVMDIDTLGTFNTSRVLYEKFFRDHGGVIVNITATLGSRGQVLQVHAGSAKAAVDAMTRHLAVEWGPQNIRVNSLAPGLISGTEGFWRLGGQSLERRLQDQAFYCCVSVLRRSRTNRIYRVHFGSRHKLTCAPVVHPSDLLQSIPSPSTTPQPFSSLFVRA
ncbi:peroxisomal 2,4-dienoyl-CoA reductase [(3E)-enoyl-CoA-producing] isoform X4 [Leopardus geoffroyi]|uniref:peroxisomal 2,4-dienoyl-CoA reductase [(3E)-enoyl-CoA-producing] isoform X4 n=1 Tax=Leopardus geoffroyi TaxID=46844 RepID=UPI001E26615E|nr:peroxisomal 2,4-dienoyl-CoA reductase [(3E)-enoyl-CoA-producing] isoform X4 [Leopardus geoffroyi]